MLQGSQPLQCYNVGMVMVFRLVFSLQPVFAMRPHFFGLLRKSKKQGHGLISQPSINAIRPNKRLMKGKRVCQYQKLKQKIS
jgi:hypothetical protein